jgi:hypothetical protein
MRLNLQLIGTGNNTVIKTTTIKVPDKTTRMSMVILAKKWAALSGVKSTTQPVDINTFVIHVPTAWQKIEVEVDRLDTTYADGLIQKENKNYVWYVPEFSYGTKSKDVVLKGVWR